MSSSLWNDSASDFGQKIDLSVRIREILRDYPSGLSIVKELIQNADDAKARSVRLVLVKPTASASSQSSPLARATAGPSLIAYNSATFSDTDFQSIQRIGDSLKKAGTGNKTGRFGVGVNSVYHLTDVPMFVSRDKLVMFDPQASHVPNINPANPGKMIDLSSQQGQALVKSLPPHVLQPMRLFKCDLRKSFDGTIFRFALRSREAAQTSRLSKSSHTVESITELLSDLAIAAESMLIFLKHVESISIYNWDPISAPEPTLTHTTSIDSPSLILRKKRSFVLEASLTNRPQVSDYALSITTTPESGAPTTSTYVVCNQLGSTETTGMANDPALAHMKLVPWSGVAARLSPSPISGEAYCFLPLPVKTGLPVHVNGYFELSSNRRDVWWGDDMAGDGKARARWNEALLTTIAAECYIRLVLQTVKSKHVTIDSYENLLPAADPSSLQPLSPLWETMIRVFFESLAEQPVLYSANLKKYISPSSAVLLSPSSPPRLSEVLLREPTLPLVLISNQTLHSTLLSRSVCTVTTTPGFIRNYFVGFTPPSLPPSCRDHDTAKFLLQYVLSDMSPGEYGDLANLPFMPLANGDIGHFASLSLPPKEHLDQLTSMGFTYLLSCHALRLFRNDLDSSIEWLFEHRYDSSDKIVHGIDPYFLSPDSDSTTLLSPSPHTFVDPASLTNDPPQLLKFFQHPNTQRILNIVTLSPPMLGDVVSKTIPSEWRGQEIVDWDPTQTSQPSAAWFKSVYKYVCQNPSCIPHIVEQYPVVPTNHGIVTNLSPSASVVFAAALEDPLKGALTKLRVHTLLDDLFPPSLLVPPELFEHIFEPSREGVVCAIDAAVRRNNDDNLFSSLSSEQISLLYTFVVSTATPALTANTAKLLSTFPIFPLYGHPPSSLPPSSPFYCLSSPLAQSDESIFSALATLPDQPKFVKVNASTSQADIKTLMQLGVEPISRHTLYLRFLLPNIGSFPPDVLNGAMSTLLTELPKINNKHPEFASVVASTACIPAMDGTLHKPCELFDPENDELKVLLDENAFPSAHFQDPNLLIPLRSLGLLAFMSFDLFIECAKRIEKSVAVENDSSHLEETLIRARNLLSFLDKNTADFFPELFPKPKVKRSLLGSVFSAASSLLTDSASLAEEKAKHEKQIEVLRQTHWVPVHLSPPSRYLPWPSENLPIVAAPITCKTTENMWLASSTYRLVDGEIYTPELKKVLGWNEAIPMRNIAVQLTAMSDSFSSHATGTDPSSEAFNQLCQEISSEVPRIYHLLNNQTNTQYDVEMVKSTLHETKWLWMGDSFVEADHAAFQSTINASPYLHTVPPDLACFSNLLHTFGVREKFGTSDFCHVLRRIHKEDEYNHDIIELTVAICQLISDDVMRLSDMEIFAPDSSGKLHPANTLVYDDAPWLSKSVMRTHHKFVHPKISSDVGEKIGVKSLRQQLITTTSESLDFGGNTEVEAFGQAESLTRRLRNIIEMYPEGPSILSELIQNADDSGASTVKVLVSNRHNATSSLLGPKMQAWQGPAIYVYNDSTFSDRDFQNLSKIGQASKLDKLITTGRFGLGFNAVFHWTDVPSFVTGDHLVMFDPHEKYVPGATSTSRGIKIKFSATDLLDQFPDQFEPYKKFGCDMKAHFKGTLFRFPLRNLQTVHESEISKTTFDEKSIDELLTTFKAAVPRFLLFLRNVKRVEVHMESDDDEDGAGPTLLYSADVTKREPLDHLNTYSGEKQARRKTSSFDMLSTGSKCDGWKDIQEFITGSPSRPLSKEAFYSKLMQTPEANLPSTQHLVSISFSDQAYLIKDTYLVCVALGGGGCRDMACDEKYRHMKFLPWGGVAAHLNRNGEDAPKTRGGAFCFLPLPVETGMPVHVNGYFELSANRRDIWTGSDMTGEGKVRSDWNELLLSDVIAPLYATMLLQARNVVGPGKRYLDLWPTALTSSESSSVTNTAIWSKVTASLYSRGMTMPLFWCNDKSWVTPNASVVIEAQVSYDDTAASLVTPYNLTNQQREQIEKQKSDKLIETQMLTDVLLKERLPVVLLPKQLMSMLVSNECSFKHATPSFIRQHFKDSSMLHPGLAMRADALFLLKYATTDLGSGDDFVSLIGLPLLPLANDAFGVFQDYDSLTPKFTVNQLELDLLRQARSEIVDTNTAEPSVNALLSNVDLQKCTNIAVLERQRFLSLLSFVFPREWDGLVEVTWDSLNPTELSESWVSKFWTYVMTDANDDGGERTAASDNLGLFMDTHPILPCYGSPSTTGVETRILMRLTSGMPVVMPIDPMSIAEHSMSNVISSILRRIGVKIIDVEIFESSSRNTVLRTLARDLVQLPNANGVLTAISNLFPKAEDGDLSRRISMKFRNVSDDDREKLRHFLRSQSDSIPDDLKRTLKALPIFPVYGAEDSFMDLLIDERWIPPHGITKHLLDSTFVDVSDRRDKVLFDALGIRTMDSKKFYLSNALPRLFREDSLPLEAREEASYKLIRDLPSLVSVTDTEESALTNESFLAEVRNSPFIPNRKGVLCKPSSLYDPDAANLSELLGSESFPSTKFSTPAILSNLRMLGMKSVLTCRGVIESASSVEASMKDSFDMDGAKRRSQCLLRFLDDNIEQLLQTCRNDDKENPAYHKIGDEVDLDAPEEPLPLPCHDTSTIEGRFVEQLAAINWLPVKQSFADQMIPLREGELPVFCSSHQMRPKEDKYMASANKYILDGNVNSDILKRCFCWDKNVDTISIAHQLIAYSAAYDDVGGSSAMIRQNLARIIPSMYFNIDEYLRSAIGEEGGQGDGPMMLILNEVKVLLDDQKWLWMGDTFVAANRVAFDATDRARPHLFSVPQELECFSTMLRFFGVREKFFALDYVRVNEELFNRMDGQQLSMPDLELAVGMAKLLAGLSKEEREEGLSQIRSPIYLPSSTIVMQPAENMVYDDAPWLSSSLGDKMRLRFVHDMVGETEAQILGARSLREVLLANQSGMQVIPCPTAESLKTLLSRRTRRRKEDFAKRSKSFTQDTQVIMDLLEVAEMAGVKKVKAMIDYRSHSTESLLHPALASCQGPAILVCFQGVVLDADALIQLSIPSGFYKSASSRFSGGNPRLGSGLCSLYQLCDCLQVLSGNQLNLFDPTGQHLFGGGDLPDGSKKKKSKQGKPVARRYALNPRMMYEDFSDQFKPFFESTFGVKDCFGSGNAAKNFFKGTIFRICLRTKASSMSNRIFEPGDLEHVVNLLLPRIPKVFLFTRSLESIDIEEFKQNGDAPRPVSKNRLRTNASVRLDHYERLSDNQDWKKSKLATLFKTWVPIRANITLEVNHIRQRGVEVDDFVDTYMVSSILAPHGMREMATSDVFKRLGIMPILRVAAHIHRSVGGSSSPFKPEAGTLFVGLDTGIKTGLPLLINAPLFLHELNRSILLDPRDDADVRSLFPSIRFVEERRSSSSGTSPMSSRSVSLWDWNREALTSSITSLVPDLLSELKHPLEYLYSRDARMIYRYWPRYEAVRPRYKAFVTPQLYSELARRELYLTKSKGFCSIQDGVFESKEFPMNKRAGAFFRDQSFAMFNVPGIVAHDIIFSGTKLQTLSPAMARNFIKRGMRREDLLRAVKDDRFLALEVLKFCLLDGKPPASNEAVTDQVRAVWRDVIGLPLMPMADGSIGTLGFKGDAIFGTGGGAIMASREKQALLPSVSSVFIDPLASNRLKEWTECEEFLQIMNIKKFDARVLADNIGKVLPKTWERKDFVPWSNDLWEGAPGVHSDQTRGPNGLWIKLFWKVIDISDHQAVSCFNKWPLIPTTSGELASCSNARFMLCISARAADLRTRRIMNLEYQGLLNTFQDQERSLADWIKTNEAAVSQSGDDDLDYDDILASETSVDESSDDDDEEEEEGSEGDETDEDEIVQVVAGPADADGELDNQRVQDGADMIVVPADRVVVDGNEELPHSPEDLPPPAPNADAAMPLAPPTESNDEAGDAVNESALAEQQQQSLEQQQQQLQQSTGIQLMFSLLKKTRAPLFELAYFSETDVERLLMMTPDRNQMSKKVLVTLVHCLQYWPTFADREPRLQWDAIEAREKDQLLEVIVFDDQRSRLGLLSSDLEKLKLLPLFETLGGTYSALGATSSDNFTLGEGLTWEEVTEFLPESAMRQFLKEKDIGDVLRDLDVEGLTESKLLMKFVLPVFVDMPRNKKDAFLTRVRAKWESLKEDAEFKTKLKETPFVRRGLDDVEEYVKPNDLMDPHHELFSAIYSNDSSKFPHEEVSHDERWLGILRELDLKTVVDKETFLLCARSVASEESVSKSMALHKYLVANFADFFDPVFARDLGGIKCVPAKSFPGYELTLTSYKNISTYKDANLSFTCSPILSEEVCPPQVMWSSLGIVSPPKIDVVLRHLRNLTKDGGFLDRWEYKEDSIIAVFGSMYKFLDDNYEKLSPRVQDAMRSTAIVPVGTVLVKPKDMFFRMQMNLQPLLYEVPRWCGGFAGLFEKIGVREAPRREDYCDCLRGMKRDIGDCVLNPNELAAVLKLCKLISELRSNDSEDQEVYGIDDRSVLVKVDHLVYNDAPWLMGRLNRTAVRVTHPRLGEKVAAALKVRKMSDCVIETLSEHFNPTVLQGGQVYSDKVKAREFGVALKGLGAGANEVGKLQSLEVKFVEELQTRLILLDKGSGRSGVDVTGQGVSATTTSFFDKRRTCLFIAIGSLPESLLPQLVVATNICDIMELDRSNVGVVSALLVAQNGQNELERVSRALRGGAGSTMIDERGVPGCTVVEGDLKLAELKPVKNFSAGEVVALEAEGGLMYANVVAVGDGSEGEVVMVRLDVGNGVTKDVFSSQVYSFKSGSIVEEPSPVTNERVEIDISLFEASNGGFTEAECSGLTDSGSSGAISRVTHEQAVRAASDILSAANINLKSDVKTMMLERMEMLEGQRRRNEVDEERKRRLAALCEDFERTTEGLICPITRSTFVDPVVAEDGFTYEREAIERWLQTSSRSPQTNAVLRSRGVVPNIALRQQLEAMQETKSKVEALIDGLATSEIASFNV